MSLWIPVLVASISFIGVMLQVWRSTSSQRDEIEQDLRIANALPEKSEARSNLVAFAESRVGVLVEGDGKRRDALGISLAILFLIVAAFCGYLTWDSNGWPALVWGVSAFVAGALGITGLVQDFPRRERNEKGRPIQS